MLKTDAIEITSELLCLIAEIDEFKGAWRALGTLAPERLKALRRVATIESIGSSTRIEGSKLTDREVERLLANLEIKKTGGKVSTWKLTIAWGRGQALLLAGSLRNVSCWGVLHSA